MLDGIAQRAASNSPFAGEGAEDAYPVEDESAPTDEHSEDLGLEQAEDTDAATDREIAESTEDLEAGEPATDGTRG